MDLENEAKAFLSDGKGHHDWEHTQRVLRLAVHIGKNENADLEIIRIAALFHDIGRPLEFSSKGKICHAKKSAELAKEILEKNSFEPEKIQRICHCIEAHRYRNKVEPQTLEAKVLFDADKLDSLGAVGIGRAFLFAGEIGSRLHNPEIDVEKTESYSKEDTAYREFMVKDRFIKDRMHTSEGKRLALERHNYMKDYFDRLTKEVQGDL